MIYLLPSFFPLLASVFCISKNDKISEFSSVFASLASIAASIYIIFMKPAASWLLYIDGFSKIMLVVISIIYLTTILFSTTYIKHVSKPLLSKSSYYLFLNLFVLSMLLSVSLNNLGFIWVGIEATTITSALLVAIDNDEASLESSWRYIIIVSTGLIMSLIGVMLIYASMHTLNISKLLNTTPLNNKLFAIGAALTIAGFSTKAGIFPMHTWLPDVHGRSIAPVSAIFSSVLLPTALFGVYRVIEISSFMNGIKMFSFILGFSTVAFASIFLITQKFYKRMFAYSSMENMGMILMGLAIDTKYALLGAVILIVSHAFAKSSAFYTTGNILSLYKTRNVNDIKGLINTIPFGAYSFVLSSLAVTGAPPFGTFLGEMLILYAVFVKFGLVLSLLILLFLAVAFFSLNYKVSKMSFSTNGDSLKRKDEVMGSFVPILNTTLAFLTIFAAGIINNLLNTGVIK